MERRSKRVEFTEAGKMVNALNYPAQILVSFKVEVLEVFTSIFLPLAKCCLLNPSDLGPYKDFETDVRMVHKEFLNVSPVLSQLLLMAIGYVNMLIISYVNT